MNDRGTSPVVLEAKNVTRTFQQGDALVHAVRDVSLSVPSGQLLAIVGRSGSGKSTLLQLLGALDQPSQGEIHINGSNLRDCSSEQAARIRGKEIGFVFQHFSLLPRLSAVDNAGLPLVYARTPKAERRARAVAVLQKLGLGDRLAHAPSELSGGQQQRVAVARALIRNPSVLLADEPTGALDRASADELLRLLLSLNRDGRTIIIVTHDRDIASMAGVVVEMADGRISSLSRGSASC